MKLYARVENGIVLEIISVSDNLNVKTSFHSSIFNQLVFCDNENVKVGWLYSNNIFSEPVETVTNTQNKELLKTAVWRRCTDAEAVLLDSALSAAPTRLRRLWEDSTVLEFDAPEWPELMAGVVAVVGEERALELLAPI